MRSVKELHMVSHITCRVESASYCKLHKALTHIHTPNIMDATIKYCFEAHSFALHQEEKSRADLI